MVEGGSVEPRVTGSDSGIGQATATLRATEGFDVGLTCHEDTAGVQGTVRLPGVAVVGVRDRLVVDRGRALRLMAAHGHDQAGPDWRRI